MLTTSIYGHRKFYWKVLKICQKCVVFLKNFANIFENFAKILYLTLEFWLNTRYYRMFSQIVLKVNKQMAGV